jgi:exopolyphosphatase / guanosine-5'-triphosphate,3'-diphosphate pyrophosphatase
MRVAGIDCGTNSVRLLVADTGPDGRLVDVVRQMQVVRLGQGVDRTGRLAPQALERTRIALAQYAATIAQLGAERVRMTATSATRDASNREDFATMVRGTLGIDADVITGAEEAALSFTGAVCGLPGVAEPLLVADIGGGSTELVLGGDGVDGLRSHSMNVGSVRMTERHLHDDPPTGAQISATVADLNVAIDRAALDVRLETAATFVGVAGTVTTVAAIALGLQHYDADAIHASVLPAQTVCDVVDRLLRMSRDERAALPVMHPGRVDVIAGGALVLRTLIERVGARQLTVSEHDILDGIAMSTLR